MCYCVGELFVKCECFVFVRVFCMCPECDGGVGRFLCLLVVEAIDCLP